MNTIVHLYSPDLVHEANDGFSGGFQLIYYFYALDIIYSTLDLSRMYMLYVHYVYTRIPDNNNHVHTTMISHLTLNEPLVTLN